MTSDVISELDIRRAEDADLPAILELLQASLGWVPDRQHSDFFRWKHRDNPFGESPAWVATDGDRIAGLRTWLRWEFEDGRRRYRAVRAVDTATHPDYRGRGVFTALTLRGLDALRDEGVDFVFNTPNEQSRPGYLKMGWREVGTLPVAIRPNLPFGPLRTVRARVPADKWSLPADAGVSAPEALSDEAVIAILLDTRPDPSGLRTRLDREVLRWRYGFEPLCYRAVWAEHGAGLALFRIRRRGPAVECVICLVIAPDPGTEARLLRRAARASGADHALRIAQAGRFRGGFVPLPGHGPVLTWREATETTMPPAHRWDLGMGDVELF